MIGWSESYWYSCSVSQLKARMCTVLPTVCLLSTFMLLALGAPGTQGPVVSLKNGKVRGGYVTVKGTETRAVEYLGIPFARPPVGPLRLAAPQPAEAWEGERDGTRQPPMCIQDPALVSAVTQIMSVEITAPEVSEDCLYLNVYTPAGAVAGDKLPVMLWIHGGGLSMGAASQSDGAPLAAYENMVVVLIQYRLGILGFLSQSPSLACLREASTLSPQAKGLFHKAIFQSGVATLGNYTSYNSLEQAKIVANLTGCEYTTTEQLVSCFRGKSEQELIDATKNVFKMKVYLGGTVDGVFLTDVAEVLLKRKEMLKVPVMLGLTNHEFGWILPHTFAPPGWQNGMSRETVLAVMNLFNPPGAASANSLMADEYLKEAKTPEDIRDGFTEILGDLLMTIPVISVAGYHRDADVPVYLYEFVHRPEVHNLTRPSFVKADHSDEVGFMFGGCFWEGHIKINGTSSTEEDSLCRTMMSYWANFARTGSPNGPGLVQWPPYDGQKQEYMELGLKQTIKEKLKLERMNFATVILPQKLRDLAAAAAAAAAAANTEN
ncbi:hypothetical protein CRUP_007539 [Coryphaenoides rupestris]|nr:hypothetical protein CRUP_007539 [Coryphaenoides rupestris]